jgi:hypothetical protein
MAPRDPQHAWTKLTNLPRPPRSWVQVSNRSKQLNTLRANQLRGLLAYHSFGFIVNLKSGTKRETINSLDHVLYYTQNGRGKNVAFTQDGIVCAGPVGPGTFQDSERQDNGLPGWYLTEEVAMATLNPNASLLAADAVGLTLEQPKASVVCYTYASNVSKYSYAQSETDPEPSGSNPTEPVVTDSPPQTHKTATAPKLAKSPALPDAPADPKPSNTQKAPTVTGDGPPSPKAPQKLSVPEPDKDSQPITTWNVPPAWTANDVAEIVRRAIVASAYSGLQIVPDAFLRARPFLLSDDSGSLFNAFQQRTLAASHFRLKMNSNGSYEFSENGSIFRYYGLGPFWYNNSCFWDSIILCCVLLNAGYTYLDRGSTPVEWEKQLTRVEKAMLDVIRMDWNYFKKETSIAQRDMFWNLFQSEFKNIPDVARKGGFDSIARRWNDIAGPFNQFKFSFHLRKQGCECQGGKLDGKSPKEVGYIEPPALFADRTNVTIAELFQRWARQRIAHECQKSGHRVLTRVIHGDLPLRIVMQAVNATLTNHTSQNISFSYRRIDPATNLEIEERATYRWLGGAYCAGNHFRVYWNDSEHGAATVTSLRIYDGNQAAGAIIGGVPPEDPHEPIHRRWRRNCPPLLFYEQVVQPDPIALQAANSAINAFSTGQNNRSVFPHTFATTATTTEPAESTRALEPRQLKGAILKVPVPSTGLHSPANKPAPLPPTPAKTPAKIRPQDPGEDAKPVGPGNADGEDQPVTPTPEQPGTANPKQPGTANPKQPDTATPEQPGIANPKHAGTPTPEQPDITTPEQPGIPTPGQRPPKVLPVTSKPQYKRKREDGDGHPRRVAPRRHDSDLSSE